VALLDSGDLRDVILVGHSYGGMVITGIADRGGRVGKLVYLGSGQSRERPVAGRRRGPVINAVRPMGGWSTASRLVLLPAPRRAFYGVTDPDVVAWMDERLTGHPWACFEQKLVLTNEDALWAIPQYHIVCTSTIATRDPELIDKARAEGRLWDIDTGHDLMLTEPRWVADTLVKVAADSGAA
jgi:pimeloyl-ACP methyl ester carboxylesterase